jgi:hypothetical protein
MVGSMLCIADAMRDTPDMAGDIYEASLTQRAAELPYMAGSIVCIADAMRNTPEMAQVIYNT